jgi:hypothetical protein
LLLSWTNKRVGMKVDIRKDDTVAFAPEEV